MSEGLSNKKGRVVVHTMNWTGNPKTPAQVTPPNLAAQAALDPGKTNWGDHNKYIPTLPTMSRKEKKEREDYILPCI